MRLDSLGSVVCSPKDYTDRSTNGGPNAADADIDAIGLEASGLVASGLET